MAARLFGGEMLVVATHNSGKAREIEALLTGRVARVVAAGALGLAEPEETGDTFAANAELKARAAALAVAERFGCLALADDSGLVVPALGGQPGIHSARWGGPERSFALAMRRVEDALAAVAAAPVVAASPSLSPSAPDRSAYFACALSLAWPDGHCETVEGRVWGSLVWPPRGGNGFGYDPIFVPRGHTRTFGEMAPAAKEAISHRADAFRQLIARCFSL